MTAGAKKKAGEKTEPFHSDRRIPTGSWGCGRAPKATFFYRMLIGYKDSIGKQGVIVAVPKTGYRVSIGLGHNLQASPTSETNGYLVQT
jgi:hypothetical protein